MSISDGLGPSISCRKMEKARPMREEMDGKVVFFPPGSALQPLMLYLSTVLFPICTLTWRVNNYVSRQEKVWIGETKVQRENFSDHFERTTQKLLRAFQNFFEILKNCIKPSSERVYIYYWLIVLTIFNQSSFLLHLSFVSQYWYCKPPIWFSKKRQSIINR